MAGKIQLDETVLSAIQSAWKVAQKLIGKPPVQAARVPDILGRLHRFHSRHDGSTVDRAVSRIAQGSHLVISALTWGQAAVGPLPYADANTQQRTLGEAWRFVASYSGFERVAKALLNLVKHDKLDKIGLSGLIDAVTLGSYPNPIQSPPPARGKRVSSADQFESSFKAFLHGRAISDWKGAIELAQTLRHLIAHGAISPTKVKQLGLRRPIFKLTADVGQLTTALLTRFAE